MSLLTKASPNELQTILDLFPLATLKGKWDFEGLKDEVCLQIAATRDFNAIGSFIHENFGICKQHIHVLKNNAELEDALRVTIPELEEIAESVTDDGVIKTYLSKHTVEVIIMTEQPQRDSISFVLPVQIKFSADYVLVCFITFARNYHAFYKGVDVYIPKKDDDRESAIIDRFLYETIQLGVNLVNADLHKGVKYWWQHEWMDSSKVKYKDELSTITQSMHDNKGVRDNNPVAYAKIKECVLHDCYFKSVEADDKQPMGFTINPKDGRIAFTSYAKHLGDYDYVVEKILKHNS